MGPFSTFRVVKNPSRTADAASHTDTEALPITVALSDPDLAADVTAHVESMLGWQVIEPGPHLQPRILLADGASSRIPTVVVCRQVAQDQVHARMREGALAVLRWPADAHRLPGLVPGRTSTRPADRVIAVGGSSAGVGTTTVALALGAACAWRGRQTLVLTGPAGAELAGVEPGRAVAVAGIAGLSVATEIGSTEIGSTEIGPTEIGTARDIDQAGSPGAASTPRAQVMIVDRGIGGRVQVLVGRPDASLLRSLDGMSPGGAVVTIGEGALRPAELSRAIGDRRHVAVEWSFRVARAGLRSRVPVALPGCYIQTVERLLPADMGRRAA